MQHTEKNLVATGRLFEALASTPPDKEAIAAMMTESFINGMNARERLMTGGSAPEQGRG